MRADIYKFTKPCRMGLVATIGLALGLIGCHSPATGGSQVGWKLATANAGFPAVSSHTVLDFNGHLWVIGGQTSGPEQLVDKLTATDQVWSSGNGKDWTQKTPAAGTTKTAGTNWFSPRFGHSSVVFNNRMWVIGGGVPTDGGTNDDADDDTDGGIVASDEVWSSADGKDWTKETTSTTQSSANRFSARFSHSSVVFPSTGPTSKIWVIGGTSGATDDDGVTSGSDEVWSSANGKDWTKETTSVTQSAANRFSARFFHNSVVFTDQSAATPTEKIYLIGGTEDKLNGNNEVWSSANGKDWAKEVDGKFAARLGSGTVVFKGPADSVEKIWLIAGANPIKLLGGVYKDIWSSNNGQTWTKQADAGFSERAGLGVVVFQNKLWIIAGQPKPTLGNISTYVPSAEVWVYP